MKKITFLVSLVSGLMFLSCQTQDSEPSILDLSNLKFDFKMDFSKNYQVSDVNEALEIASDYFSEFGLNEFSLPESQRNPEFADLPNGLLITMTEPQITFEPIEFESFSSSPFGEGWTDLGTCYSQNCVQEKLTEALAPVASGEGCVEVKVIRTLFNARVCSKACDPY